MQSRETRKQPLQSTIVVRLTPKQKKKLEQVRQINRFDTLSQALRFVVEVHG
jgi:DNA-binding MarR family transcriptional regulator